MKLKGPLPRSVRLDIAALLEALREETQPLLAPAREALVLARSEGKAASVAPVRELLHRLSGSAAPAGLPHLSRLARFGEEFAVLVLNGDAKLTDATFTLLGRFVDAAQAELDGTGSGLVNRPAAAPAPAVKPAAAATAPAEAPKRAGKVLLVGADPVSARLFGRCLTDASYETEKATLADTMSGTFARYQPDVMLVDLGGAPDPIDVKALLARAHEQHVPTMLLSRADKSDPTVQAVISGADELLVKPIAPDKLVEKVTSHVERRRAVEAARARAPTARWEAPPSLELTLLVVDDSRVIRGLVKEFLAVTGARILEAEDGVKALAVIGDKLPDAVIVDMQMPELDGLGLTRALRLKPGGSTLPIILLSAMDDPDSRKAGTDAGANAYMVKNTFDAPELLTALRKIGVKV